jgi:CHAT domain-containing protein
VISCLWPVEDVAMTLLYSEFYACCTRGRDLAGALADARTFVRNSSHASLQSRIDEIARGDDRQRLQRALDSIAQTAGKTAPLSNPYFWAATVCSGRP